MYEPHVSDRHSAPAISSDSSSLQQQLRMLETILDTASDHIYAFTRSLHILYAGLSGARAHGLTPEQMRGMALADLNLSPELLTQFSQEFETVFTTQKPSAGTCLYRTVYGVRRYEYTITPVFDAAGEVVAVVSRAHDITDRYQAEIVLRESERFVHRVLDNLFAFVGVMSPDGTLLQANRAPLEAAGISEGDVIGRKFWDCYWWSYSPSEQERLKESIVRALEGEIIRYDVQVRMAGNHLMWIDFQIAPLRDATGRITHIIPSGMDLTDRRRAELALQESEERVRLATEAAGLGIWTWEPHTDQITLENDLAFDIMGIPTNQEPIDAERFIAEFVRPEDRAIFTRSLHALLEDNSPFNFEGRFRRSDGQIRWGEFTGRQQPVTGASSRRVVGTVIDITARKGAEQTLQERSQEIEVLNVRLLRAMRETHHRVKNNLQVISALAEMQTETDDPVPAGAMRRVGRHARNLAALHDLLTQEATLRHGVDNVSARATLKKLIPLLQTGGRRLKSVCDDFLLPVRECGALTLLVSELVSNAVKHGAGDITVNLSTTINNINSENRNENNNQNRNGNRNGNSNQNGIGTGNRNAILEVADEGKGFPSGFDPTEAARTGLDLILMLARHDLRGFIAFENLPEGGARVRVTFPI